MQKILKLLFRYWMKFARFLGFLNTRVLLLLTYLLFIGPMAVVLKILRKDLLDRKITGAPSYWKDKPPVDVTLERNKHQF